MPEAKVREIAKGRVWSGNSAAELNLVTDIGGFLEAVEKAKELSGISADSAVNVQIYPAPENPFEAFGEMFGASAETQETAAKITKILEDERFQAFIEQAGTTTQKRGTQMSAPIVKEN